MGNSICNGHTRKLIILYCCFSINPHWPFPYLDSNLLLDPVEKRVVPPSAPICVRHHVHIPVCFSQHPVCSCAKEIRNEKWYSCYWPSTSHIRSGQGSHFAPFALHLPMRHRHILNPTHAICALVFCQPPSLSPYKEMKRPTL